MSGLSLEALNDIGHRRTQLLIVLNDNEMSISPTVGALSQVPLGDQALAAPGSSGRRAYDRLVERVPVVGPTALELSRRLRKSVVSFAQPGQLFEDLGITYIGVVPGPRPPRPRAHLPPRARRCAGRSSSTSGPRRGGATIPPRRDQVGFHGAALPPMTDAATEARRRRRRAGQPARRRRAARPTRPPERPAGRTATPVARRPPRRPPTKAPNYTAHFAAELVAAGPRGPPHRRDHGGHAHRHRPHRSQAEFPDRFIDVGIAEQHAVALATGLAMGGMRPVVAIYSTFLQRAFDQIVHDVCQNDQPVLIGVDRAGLVGEDGTSHQGMFTHPGPAPAAEPRHRQPEGRAGAALAGPDGARAGPPVRAALPARRRLRRAGARAGDPPDRPGRGPPRGRATS